MSAAAADAFRSFLDKWLEAEPDAQLLRLFVPAARAPGTTSILVLMHELEAAALDLDPQPAQAKLAWWHEELGRWRAGAARHPITLALPRGDSDEAVSALPATASRWLSLDTVSRYGEWQECAQQHADAQGRALAEPGPADPAPALARLLMRFDRLAADPRGLLPLDVLAEAGATRAQVSAAPNGAEARRALAALARRALEAGTPTGAGSELAAARSYLARRTLEALARGREPARAARPGFGAVLGLRRALRRARAAG